MRYCGSTEERAMYYAWRRIMEGLLEMVCVAGGRVNTATLSCRIKSSPVNPGF